MLTSLPLYRISRAAAALRGARRDQRGFTLVEVLVAMITGVIVTGALFTILDFSVKQSARLSGSAQATQVSRVAMTHLVEQLHSACISAGFTPVIKESSPTKLVFVNGYDEKEEPKNAVEPPAELLARSIHKDVVEYNKATGRLIDTTYKATSNVPLTESAANAFEKYSFSSTPTSTVRLAEHVSQMEEGGKTIPVFQYYAYATTSSTGTGEVATTLNEKSLTTTETALLTEAGAAKVASVVVSFRTEPPKLEAHLSSKSEKGTVADLTTQTTFAFGAPNSETTIQASPCE